MVRRAWLLGLAAGATVLWVATVNALLNLTASAFNVHAYRWWLLIVSVIVSVAAGTVAGIRRAAHHHGPDARESAHHQLPMDIDEFTGRLEQLRQLDRLVTRPASRPAAPVIWAISGMPGAGKTRLAIHAAHVQVSAGRFTDIQLSVDLSGFDPARAADPAAVLDRFLRVLGIPPAKIPVELDARSALYRSQLSGRKGIILLDNAASAEQVRPLLPGTPEILVIVTSRRSLGSLDGCQPLLLEPFRPDESLELLARIAGSDRVGNEPEAATRVTELCAHLPYAVTLAARRIRIRRTWTIRYLADRLRPADHRLDELGRPDQALRMSFDLSYDTVDSEQRRVLGLLALHPGKDVTVPSVAALGNIPAAQAEQVLEDLLDVSLLIQETAGRYKVHDLLRLYALERVKENLSPEDRAVAQVRVVDWYLRTVDAANRHLNKTSRRPGMPETAITPLTFTSYDDALQWCEQERANLLAAAELAAIVAPETAWKLAVTLWRFYQIGSYWSDWAAANRIGLDATLKLGDPFAEAWIRNSMGVLYENIDQFPEGIKQFRQALNLRRQAKDVDGEADSLHGLGIIYVQTAHYDEAARVLQRGLIIRQKKSDRHGEGLSHLALGALAFNRRQYEESATHYSEAQVICRELGDQAGEAANLANLGEALVASGQIDAATICFKDAIRVFESLHDRRSQGWILEQLSQVEEKNGREQMARTYLVQALKLYEEIGHPGAAAIRIRLASMRNDE